MGQMRNVYILIGKCDRKRPLARPEHRWEDNIKTILKSRVWSCGLHSIVPE
jgi:hypothetical protein